MSTIRSVLRELASFVGISLFFGAIGLVLMFPKWVHVIHSDRAVLRPSELAERGHAIYRVALDGDPLLDDTVTLSSRWFLVGSTTTQVGDSQRELYVPVVDPGEDPTAPVHAVFHTVGSGFELRYADPRLPAEQRERLDGRIRDAPMEGGLPKLAREQLAAKGVNLAPDVRVVDSYATSLDRGWAYGGTFAFFVLGLFTAEQQRIDRKKKHQQRAPEPAKLPS